jgi:hypothetical protein
VIDPGLENLVHEFGVLDQPAGLTSVISRVYAVSLNVRAVRVKGGQHAPEKKTMRSVSSNLMGVRLNEA